MRSCVTKMCIRDSLYLDTYSFNDRTVLVGAEDETAALLEAGRDPGLGVRSLQARGITGQGVKIAIIDQSLLTDHPEISGAIAAYCETGIDSGLNEGTLHGPAVASILAGQTVGVAPGAVSYTHLDVYKRQGQSGCGSAANSG